MCCAYCMDTVCITANARNRAAVVDVVVLLVHFGLHFQLVIVLRVCFNFLPSSASFHTLFLHRILVDGAPSIHFPEYEKTTTTNITDEKFFPTIFRCYKEKCIGVFVPLTFLPCQSRFDIFRRKRICCGKTNFSSNSAYSFKMYCRRVSLKRKQRKITVEKWVILVHIEEIYSGILDRNHPMHVVHGVVVHMQYRTIYSHRLLWVWGYFTSFYLFRSLPLSFTRSKWPCMFVCLFVYTTLAMASVVAHIKKYITLQR